MPESKVHYGGDEGLERRVNSLESGDAWDGAASGRVLTSGTPPTWEESSGGGGGSSSAGDRAKLEASAYDSDTFSFVLVLADPQPSAAAVPTGWTISDGGLTLPAGVYWVGAVAVGVATGTGAWTLDVNFFEDWNDTDQWGTGTGPTTVDVIVEDGATGTAKSAGVVSTGDADELRIFPSAEVAAATDPAVQLWVTRLA